MSLPGIGNGTGLPTGSTNDGATSNDPQAATAWVDSNGNITSGLSQASVSGGDLPTTIFADIYSANTSLTYRVTDIGDGLTPWRHDGTRWRPVSPIVLARFGNQSALTNNDTNWKYPIVVNLPAGLLGPNDNLSSTLMASASNDATVKNVNVILTDGTNEAILYRAATNNYSACMLPGRLFFSGNTANCIKDTATGYGISGSIDSATINRALPTQVKVQMYFVTSGGASSFSIKGFELVWTPF